MTFPPQLMCILLARVLILQFYFRGCCSGSHVFFLQLKRFGPAGNGSLWVRLFCAGLTRLSVLIHVKRKRGTRLRFSLLTF